MHTKEHRMRKMFLPNPLTYPSTNEIFEKIHDIRILTKGLNYSDEKCKRTL